MVRRVAQLQLETDRLRLRRFVDADLPIALEHELDPTIMAYIRDLPSLDEARARVARLCDPWAGNDGEWVGLAIVPHDVGHMVGLLAFRVVAAAHESVELGFRLHAAYHRRGYTFAACRTLLDFLFEVAGVRKVISSCVADNAPSYRLLEKLGMRREGHLRRHSMLGGVWHDELVYGLFADERARIS